MRLEGRHFCVFLWPHRCSDKLLYRGAEGNAVHLISIIIFFDSVECKAKCYVPNLPKFVEYHLSKIILNKSNLDPLK